MNIPPSSLPIVDEPFPPLQRWGAEEAAQLSSMVEQSSLFYWKGPQTDLLLSRFRALYPLRYAFACSSGSAALHIAVAALRLKPGDEVIVPPITDMGSVIGILYQQAVPVFADLEPDTGNLSAKAVRTALTSRTRAIMAVHLAGNPADLHALRAIADEHAIALIEDCAQAWGARWQGQPVGTVGDFGCFSFNDFKHVSSGDGGVVGTNRDTYGPGLSRWGDKSYDRVKGGRDPEDLAPNYRISEPQAAVAAVQLTKLGQIVERRCHAGTRLGELLGTIDGLRLPVVRTGDQHSYWFLLTRLEAQKFRVSRAELVAALKNQGVECTAGYLPRPVYRYPVFQNHNFFGGAWPVRDAGYTAMDYRQVQCPVAEEILNDCIVFRINEAMTDRYIEKLAKAVRVVFGQYRR